MVSRLELATSELAVSLNDVAKNCQGKVAAQTMRIRGVPSGTLLPKSQPMNHMAPMVSNGRTTAHSTPMVVCL